MNDRTAPFTMRAPSADKDGGGRTRPHSQRALHMTQRRDGVANRIQLDHGESTLPISGTIRTGSNAERPLTRTRAPLQQDCVIRNAAVTLRPMLNTFASKQIPR